jgi:hypothetical protein
MMASVPVLARGTAPETGASIRTAPSRFDLTFQVESQLLVKEDVFRFDGSARTGSQKKESSSVLGQIEKDGDQTKRE